MVNFKILTAVAAFASLGIAAPIAMAEDTSPATTIHEESPRASTGVSVGSDPNAAQHNRGEADDAVHTSAYKKTYPTESEIKDTNDATNGDGADITGPDDAVRTSAYKKTYPTESEMKDTNDATNGNKAAITKPDDAVHTSAYKKTYPEEAELNELDE
jgi:hypothetical protein